MYFAKQVHANFYQCYFAPVLHFFMHIWFRLVRLMHHFCGITYVKETKKYLQQCLNIKKYFISLINNNNLVWLQKKRK
jgi:hypothetical protein